MTPIRTRFAPSPTGYLHIGGARTALFNWLYARHHGGTFILRIEDTDQVRSTPESTKAILDGMTWLGLDWDEGPFYQSERYDLYREHIGKMLAAGTAYRCYCTSEELDSKRELAMAAGKKPKYDGTCRALKSAPAGDKPFTVRFKGPSSGETVIDDMIKGRVVFDNAELDDLIIARSDGAPTYNFVVVVDDAIMGITHIIRGDDHLNNTPRQKLLYEALGYRPPLFGHVPLILGADRKRLSKRHGATSVTSYEEEGYLPEALVNYLARLGWSHGDQEIFTREELIRHFDAPQIGKSAGVFNEEKLQWLNAHYLREMVEDKLAALLKRQMERQGLDPAAGPPLPSILPFLKERSKTLVEMSLIAGIYYRDTVELPAAEASKFLSGETAEILRVLAERLGKLEDFSEGAIEAVFNGFLEEKGLKMGKVAQPVRFSLTGGTASPGLFQVMALLGKKRTLARIEQAVRTASEIKG